MAEIVSAGGNGQPEKDPIVHSSLSKHLMFWGALLFATTVWSLWDETVTKRPWKTYQRRFVEAYDEVLTQVLAERDALERRAENDPELQEIEKRLEEEEAKHRDEIAQLDRRASWLKRRIEAIRRVIKFPKAEIGALIYRIETSSGERRRRLEERLRYVRSEARYEVELPEENGGTRVSEKTYEEWEKTIEELKAERARVIKRRATLDREAQKIRKERDRWLAIHMPGVSTDQLVGIKRALDSFKVEIKQIHVADVGLVDRCQSCHLGITEPVSITRERLAKAGVTDPSLQTAFVSHPRPGPLDNQPDLLAIHPPERFGCSPCHGGNGTGTVSAFLAHGLNKHWIWKLYEKENFEAGCQQCHEGSLVLDGAPTLNLGRELFRHRGCWGCHKREGFDRESEELKAVQSRLKDLLAERDRKLAEQRQVLAIIDDPEAELDAVERAIARSNELTVEMSQLETDFTTLRKREAELGIERKRQGPNLKEIKAKLKRDWLPVWIRKPTAFRPSTKMPEFRLTDKQVRAIAAFLWQSALDVPIEKQPPGNPERGKELFEKRGCMACHRVNGQGGDFAADLSRIGEKANYDYLVRWIKDPRRRLLPYSLEAGRDITIEDYRRAGKEPIWDREHTICPVTGGALVVENQTVMPELRLTWEECRDIASYLVTLKTDQEYEPAPWLEDKSLFKVGERYVRHFGCFGCHEIRGLEFEDPIGTELTKEGSKPLERLDFGLLTYEFKRKKDARGVPLYSHKHFFMNKLRQPEIWDKGKVKPELEKLRMPNFNLDERELVALTTFLLGSVDSRYPPRFYYKATGPKKAIEDGWWIVKKYNCVGCHEIRLGEKPAIQQLEWFSGDNIGDAPPSLVGQGFRTNPTWLAKFLRNPALTDDPQKIHRNGVREYLAVRMPTFHLTDNEIQKLVAFFAALANQPVAPVLPPIDPLPPEGVAAARAAFEKEVCLKCHITDGPLTPQVIAPSFLISGERLNPEWMRRWLIDPQKLMPGTKMPSGIFEFRDGRWVFKSDPSTWPEELRRWPGDHVDLLVRYMRQYNLINGTQGSR